MSTSLNQEHLRRLVEELWNEGNLAVIDELVHENYINHTAGPGEDPGREGMKQAVIAIRHAFPDFHLTIDDFLMDGDKVVNRWTARGTHKGEFRGLPATQRSLVVSGITISHIVDGRETESWQYSNFYAMLQQLAASR